MSATRAGPLALPRRRRTSDLGRPAAFVGGRILPLSIAIAVAFLVARDFADVYATWTVEWPSLVFWMCLVVLVDLFPVELGSPVVTLDLPILLAVAVLYDPPTAALLGFVSAVDPREWRGRISVLHALFNRAQIALSVYLAGWAFHSLVGESSSDLLLIGGTATALVVDIVANISMVGLYLALRNGGAFSGVVSSLRVADVPQLLGVHLGYGIVALILAVLFRDVGWWSVLLLMGPVLAARQLLVRNQQLDTLSKDLRERERLLERSLQRIVEERRDERLRVAGELHDEVLQELTHVGMLANLVKRAAEGNRTLAADTDSLRVGASKAVDSLRKVMTDLRESGVGGGGLIAALQRTAMEFQLEWQVPIAVSAPSSLRIPRDIETALFLVAREALVNAAKHSRANRIDVSITVSNDEVALCVRDDGCGFDSATSPESGHFGLLLMTERMERVRGTLRVESSEGQGTAVRAAVPNEAEVVVS